MEHKTKVLIIGSGPAGYTAAIYAARAGLDPILVTGSQPGGQLTITSDVENYPGFSSVIQGPWLMEEMEKQAEKVGTIIFRDHVTKVDLTSEKFFAYGESNQFEADSVIIATGASAKWLGLDSEQKFMGSGISGCATCDGFFYRNKVVAVIGGGNTAVEEALYLTHHASKVYLIHRREELRAEKILQKRLFANPKITVMWNKVVEDFVSDNGKFLEAIHLKDVTNDSIKSILPVDGAFIAIGHKPNTDIFTGQLDLDSEGYIVTKPGTSKTSIPGVFACGDVQDKIYRQAVTAAGTGCMAALDVEKFLSSR